MQFIDNLIVCEIGCTLIAVRHYCKCIHIWLGSLSNLLLFMHVHCFGTELVVYMYICYHAHKNRPYCTIFHVEIQLSV